VRDVTPAEKQAGNPAIEFMRLAKLPENLLKSEAQVRAMMGESGEN
jgi:hypothetical protein